MITMTENKTTINFFDNKGNSVLAERALKGDEYFDFELLRDDNLFIKGRKFYKAIDYSDLKDWDFIVDENSLRVEFEESSELTPNEDTELDDTTFVLEIPIKNEKTNQVGFIQFFNTHYYHCNNNKAHQITITSNNKHKLQLYI